jgi:2-polyprenyl-3-methyl-5-hydroxy-6-metoxy-1,4-benzoquinol methylase
MQKPTTHSSTLIVHNYVKAASINATNQPNYKGLAIHALPGLHQFVADLAEAHFKTGDLILDLAAGSGAMAQRLKDSGFNVCAADYVAENFRLHDSVPFFQANLNEIFSEKVEAPVAGIDAIEIIEHLENPRHFARECFRILPIGGKMIFSTPNIDCPVSKALFTRSGEFLWFDKKEYYASGHITPISQKQIHEIFAESGFELCWEGSFGNAEERIAGSPRMLMLAKLFSFISSTAINGEIYVAVLQKPSK